MKSYQGPSITVDEENARSASVDSLSRSGLYSKFAFQRVLIKSFNEEELSSKQFSNNLATVETADGFVIENVKVATPLSEILFFHGLPKDLSNIPGILFYLGEPSSGFVLIGEMSKENTEKNPLYNSIFYVV